MSDLNGQLLHETRDGSTVQAIARELGIEVAP